CGQRLDHAQSCVDCRINRDDGTSLRIHALLAPPSESGTCISIRVLRQSNNTLDDLVANNTITSAIAETLRALIKARLSFLVIGGPVPAKLRCYQHCYLRYRNLNAWSLLKTLRSSIRIIRILSLWLRAGPIPKEPGRSPWRSCCTSR